MKISDQPEQRGETLNQDEGERHLWVSVIKYAYECLTVSKRLKNRNTARNAEYDKHRALWFFNSGTSSFPWICRVLDLPEEDIRRQANNSKTGNKSSEGKTWEMRHI